MNFNILKNILDQLTDWKIPGNSISVCIDNKEVFNYQSGYSNLENGIKMNEDRLFNIYSCTKVLTVTAALQLYEKGFFKLDDPLYDFIPEYKDMFVKDENGNVDKAKKIITLRQLFTMTAGINCDPNTPAFDRAREATGGKMDTLTVIKYMAQEPLYFEPGEKWMYGFGHDVLAGLVEVISGKKYRDYVNENICQPLGMTNTYFHNESVIDKLATTYWCDEFSEEDIAKLHSGAGSDVNVGIRKMGNDVSYVFGSEYDSGGAGITTCVSDYSKFASAMANGGIGANKEQIISAKTIELLRSNQLSGQPRADYDVPALAGYSYGLGVRTLLDVQKSGGFGTVGEFGWGGAAGADTLIDPERKLSMFYAQHILNSQSHIYHPLIRKALYASLE